MSEYPDEDELERLRNWDDLTDPHGWLALARELWAYPEMWWVEEFNNSDGVAVTRHTMATGGWSGNEDVISAMHGCAVFWLCHWESSHRGGKHVFEVKK